MWSTTIDGKCCERPQVTADGKTLVVGSNLQDYWYKLDAQTGKLLAIIHAPGSPSAHNLNLSADGKLAFMSPNGKLLQIADVATRQSRPHHSVPGQCPRAGAQQGLQQNLCQSEQFPGLS